MRFAFCASCCKPHCKAVFGKSPKVAECVELVVAPVLIGGKDTATLIDGQSLHSESELSELGVLKLIECKVLEDSYLRLRYKVIG